MIKKEFSYGELFFVLKADVDKKRTLQGRVLFANCWKNYLPIWPKFGVSWRQFWVRVPGVKVASPAAVPALTVIVQ